MQIHPNIKNLTFLIIFCAFSFIGYIIITSGGRFPDVELELRDIISYAIVAIHIGGRAIVEVAEAGGSLDVLRKTVAGVGAPAGVVDELQTRADRLSNSLILSVFQRFPGLQIVAEERNTIEDDEEGLFDMERYRSQNTAIWYSIKETIERLPSKKVQLSKISVWIDPLDATQEFTEGLLEYVSVMVCIALDGRAIFGAIYRPFSNELVIGLEHYGIIRGNGEKWNGSVVANAPKKVLISRSHAGEVKALLNGTLSDEYSVEMAAGSGYKILQLINGTAQIYLHRTKIKKWDVCAGNALINAIDGAALIDLNGNSIDYSYIDQSSATNYKNNGYELNEGILVAIRNPFTILQRLRSGLREDISSV